jgi:hypothetical protein
MCTIASMGARPEREVARARADCVAASHRLGTAFAAVLTTGVQLGPRGSGRDLPRWTRGDVEVMLELQAALATVISARRTYDALRRHGRPYDEGK